MKLSVEMDHGINVQDAHQVLNNEFYIVIILCCHNCQDI